MNRMSSQLRAIDFLVELPPLPASAENVFLAHVGACQAHPREATGGVAFRGTDHVTCQADQSRDFRAGYKGKWVVINTRMWNWSCGQKEPRALVEGSLRLPRRTEQTGCMSDARGKLVGVGAAAWGEQRLRFAHTQAPGKPILRASSPPATVLLCF